MVVPRGVVEGGWVEQGVVGDLGQDQLFEEEEGFVVGEGEVVGLVVDFLDFAGEGWVRGD